MIFLIIETTAYCEEVNRVLIKNESKWENANGQGTTIRY